MRPIHVLLAVSVLLIPRPIRAQTTATPPTEARLFFDVNLFGTAQSLSKSREFRSEFIAFSELASMTAVYPKPSRTNFPLFEIGGGVRLSRSWALSASYAHTVYEDSVDLAATIPDPELLNAAATGTGVTGSTLSRKEEAVHLSAVLVPFRTTRTRWRLVGGPSFFLYSTEMVRDVSYVSNLSSPQPAITITGFSSAEVNARALGFHAGGDFEYLLTNWFGLTAGARYDYGTVTVDREPLSAVEQKIRVGSTRLILGVRFHGN